MPPRSAPADAATGTLYVVATPIGNLGDLSPRAREILASVALVAAEDTRHTGQLLQHCAIDTPLTSLHEHSEAHKVAELAARLASGASIAIVSDAGTPLISDPGFDLVVAARQCGAAVMAIPGPCAAITALSIAGLPTDRFVFEGFLPAKSAARRARLEELASERRTLICYETPHRLQQALDDMRVVFGGRRRAAVCRELTKRFETTYTGTLAELAEQAAVDVDMSRGELVMVIAGNDAAPEASTHDADQILRALLEELAPSQAAKIAARLTGLKRAELYDRALQLNERREK